MIKYGLDIMEELIFDSYRANVELRDNQWVDIALQPTLSPEGALIPSDMEDFSILAICNHEGMIAQIVPQDMGCDCEYQLTFSEKEQVRAYVESPQIQALILAKIEAIQ